MKTEHNQAEEVTEQAKEELARAKLIRRGADQNLFQALKTA
jgi:hypothetical protein